MNDNLKFAVDVTKMKPIELETEPKEDQEKQADRQLLPESIEFEFMNSYDKKVYFPADHLPPGHYHAVCTIEQRIEELKPCPFCGSETHVFTTFYDYYTNEQVCCKRCSACGPAEGTRAAAIAAWNRRA